jgi:hypothetical protein
MEKIIQLSSYKIAMITYYTPINLGPTVAHAHRYSRYKQLLTGSWKSTLSKEEQEEIKILEGTMDGIRGFNLGSIQIMDIMIPPHDKKDYKKVGVLLESHEYAALSKGIKELEEEFPPNSPVSLKDIADNE